MKPKEHATTERIILSVEIVQGGKDAYSSIRVPSEPFMDATCTGEWVENAIREMRNDCKQKLKDGNTDDDWMTGEPCDSVRAELNAAAKEFMEGMASNE